MWMTCEHLKLNTSSLCAPSPQPTLPQFPSPQPTLNFPPPSPLFLNFPPPRPLFLNFPARSPRFLKSLGIWPISGSDPTSAQLAKPLGVVLEVCLSLGAPSISCSSPSLLRPPTQPSLTVRTSLCPCSKHSYGSPSNSEWCLWPARLHHLWPHCTCGHVHWLTVYLPHGHASSTRTRTVWCAGFACSASRLSPNGRARWGPASPASLQHDAALLGGPRPHDIAVLSPNPDSASPTPGALRSQLT